MNATPTTPTTPASPATPTTPATLPTPVTGPNPLPATIALGRLAVHPVTLTGAVRHIVGMIAAKRGGFVVTPNVDHVCLVEHDEELRSIYGRADLVLTDGQPLVWLARALRTPVPEKVSGSDITIPLLRAVRDEDRSVYLLGSTDAVCRDLRRELAHLVPGLRIVGAASPMFDPATNDADFVAALDEACAETPDLLLLALGSPKQEYAIGRYVDRYRPVVAIGVGATFDFLVGKQKRAPKWMSDAGLEWVFRLSQNPKRLWRRYLVDDRKFVGIAWRAWRNRPSSSVPPTTSTSH